jgi:ParB family transcriptional regulator, chromosome partitioning protein
MVEEVVVVDAATEIGSTRTTSTGAPSITPSASPREGCQHAATVVEKTVWQPDYYCLDRDGAG